jgi:hypothetical protein
MIFYPFSHVTVDEGITHIGNWWFAELDKLKEVSLPSTLQSIGEGAFYRCGNVSEISIPDNVNTIGRLTFQHCAGLKHLTVSAGSKLEIIDEGAFMGSGLSDIFIPNSVYYIGSHAFRDCSSLKSVTIPAGSTLGDEVFRDSGLESVTVNDNVTFGKNVFQDCKITFAGRINEITEWMFQECGSLNNIPNGVTFIGDCAFDHCYDLQTVNIPNSVTSIGDHAFYITGLISVTIPTEFVKELKPSTGKRF